MKFSPYRKVGENDVVCIFRPQTNWFQGDPCDEQRRWYGVFCNDKGFVHWYAVGLAADGLGPLLTPQ